MVVAPSASDASGISVVKSAGGIARRRVLVGGRGFLRRAAVDHVRPGVRLGGGRHRLRVSACLNDERRSDETDAATEKKNPSFHDSSNPVREVPVFTR